MKYVKKKNYIGIEVGQDCVKVIRMVKVKKQMFIQEAEVITLQGGLIENGVILEPEKVCEAIKSKVKIDPKKNKTLYCIIKSTLPITTKIELPKIASGDLTEDMLIQLQSKIPIDTSQYLLYSKDTNNSKNTRRMKKNESVVLALPKASSVGVMKLTKCLGMQCKTITLISEVMAAMILKQYTDTMKKPTMILIVEEKETYISVYQDGITQISKRMSYTSFDEGIVAKIIVELEKIVAFYKQGQENQEIERAYIKSDASITAMTAGLEHQLSFECVRVGEQEEGCSYMRYIRETPINLIPTQNKWIMFKKCIRKQYIFYGIECMTVLTIALSSFTITLKKEKTYENMKETLQEEKYHVVQALNEEINKQEQALISWESGIEDLQQQKSINEDFIEVITCNMPRTFKGTSYYFEGNSAKIEGIITDLAVLDELLQHLKESYIDLEAEVVVNGIGYTTQQIPITLTMKLGKDCEVVLENE